MCYFYLFAWLARSRFRFALRCLRHGYGLAFGWQWYPAELGLFVSWLGFGLCLLLDNWEWFLNPILPARYFHLFARVHLYTFSSSRSQYADTVYGSNSLYLIGLVFLCLWLGFDLCVVLGSSGIWLALILSASVSFSSLRPRWSVYVFFVPLAVRRSRLRFLLAICARISRLVLVAW